MVTIEAVDVDMTSSSVGIADRWFKPGATTWVSLPGHDWPVFEVGDCVVGSGGIAGFSCAGPDFPGFCDAVRFEADALEIVEEKEYSDGGRECPYPDIDDSPGPVVFSGPIREVGEVYFEPEGWPGNAWSFTVDSSNTNQPDGANGTSPSSSLVEMKLLTDKGWIGGSTVRPGDCIYGWAYWRRYECGYNCDAEGLIIYELRLRLG
jgi:hypothetical protein